jgi:AraC-like DNA-binding protein
LRLRNSHPAYLPFGAILVVEPANPIDWLALRRDIYFLRQELPAAPVVLRLREDVSSSSLDVARRAGQLCVRAILTDGKDVAVSLRPILTTPTDLGSDVVEWLLMMKFELPPKLSTYVVDIFHESGRHHDLASLAQPLEAGLRGMRAIFRRANIPSPGKWLQLARVLSCVFLIQRYPARPMLQIAVDAGYSDLSALSRQVYRLFGFRPGLLRGTLGWEWLVLEWLHRSV